MPREADRRQRLEAALRERLQASHVEVIDDSALHAGHAGAASGGGHFRALIVSPLFEGLGPLERQRRVYAALADLLGTAIHALSMRTLTPRQWAEVGSTPAAAATPRGRG